MTHIIIRDVALVTDLWCFGSSSGSGAPRMRVAGPSRRLPSCRRRKRLRPGVGWWGSPVRFIVDLGCGYPFLVWFVFLWLLISGVWETLIFGTGDWFAFGGPFFCGLFTPTYPLPGHRLVPESQHIYIYMLKVRLGALYQAMCHGDCVLRETWAQRSSGEGSVARTLPEPSVALFLLAGCGFSRKTQKCKDFVVWVGSSI